MTVSELHILIHFLLSIISSHQLVVIRRTKRKTILELKFIVIEHYVDLETTGVTLACDDIQMHAHKMISKLICTTLQNPNPKKQSKLTLVFGKPQLLPPSPPQNCKYYWTARWGRRRQRGHHCRRWHGREVQGWSSSTWKQLLTVCWFSNTSPAQKSFYSRL